MHLIVFHSGDNYAAGSFPRLLELADSGKAVAEIALGSLARCSRVQDKGHPVITIPEKWRMKFEPADTRISYYNGRLPVGGAEREKTEWFVFSNGRFASKGHKDCFGEMLSACRADMVAVNITPLLLSYQEKAVFTGSGNIAGFCRLYTNSVSPGRITADWPHHIFIKSGVVENVLHDCVFPTSFNAFCGLCENKSIKFCAVQMGGRVLDLETEAGLWAFLTTGVDFHDYHRGFEDADCREGKKFAEGVSQHAKIFGKVIFGDNVRVNKGAVIVGPAIIGSDVIIASDAMIRASVIGTGVEIPKGAFVQNRVIFEKGLVRRTFSNPGSISLRANKSVSDIFEKERVQDNFRVWRWFSYPRIVKRIADIIASLTVLTLFAPVFPVVALAIKLTSAGPVFFGHKRQGLHGKEFKCLKFRTMITGADKIQEKLRFKNEVDGPQFKVEDDPRVTAVGKFLRDTYIDEIPQFINILLGQMSVVGPRPSPESENSQCPFWRDARLSVRPGVTGLWQIYRTRKPYRDFQEWIYFDTQYTRNLSLKMDFSICWRTARKLIINFIDRF